MTDQLNNVTVLTALRYDNFAKQLLTDIAGWVDAVQLIRITKGSWHNLTAARLTK